MAKQEAITIPKEVEQELVLLRGFRDIVAERTGYYFGAKMLTKTMNEKTATERKAVREIGKTLRKAISDLIETPTKTNSQNVKKTQKQLEEARDKNKEARKPHLTKINPLRKAVRYIDTVAVPDALKELGKPAQPRFSLSDWVTKAIAPKK